MSQVAQAERDARNAGSQTYPGYREAEAQWTGKVPKSWKLRKLKYAAKFTPERASEASIHLPYVGLEHIESETGKLLELDEETTPESTVHRFRAGDVLFGKLRPYLAKVWEARQDGDCTSELVVLRPREEVSPSFLHYQLLAPPFIDAVDAQTYGAKMPRVSPQQLGDMYVAVPSQEEQKSIAQFLNIQTSRIDRLIDKKKRLIELLEERRTTLITKAVTKGLDSDVPMKDSGVEWLGEIPEHWEVTQLKRVTECLDSRRIPLNAEERSRRQGPYPYWGANGVVDHLDDFLFDQPLVLLGEDGAPFFEAHKDVAFSVEGKIWVNNHIHVLRPRSDTIEQDFLTHLLNCVSYGSFIGGSTRDKLTQTEMGRIPVQLPPLDEQEEIVRHLQPELTRMQRVSGRVNEAIRRLKEYRSSLITAAVTGKIDVRDQAA